MASDTILCPTPYQSRKSIFPSKQLHNNQWSLLREIRLQTNNMELCSNLSHIWWEGTTLSSKPYGTRVNWRWLLILERSRLYKVCTWIVHSITKRKRVIALHNIPRAKFSRSSGTKTQSKSNKAPQVTSLVSLANRSRQTQLWFQENPRPRHYFSNSSLLELQNSLPLHH